jgi:leucyl aminopeptidase
MVNILNENIFDLESDALVVGFYEGDENQSPLFKQLNLLLNGELDLYLKEGDLSLQYKKLTKFFTVNRLKAKRLYIIGLGKRENIHVTSLRSAYGFLFKHLHKDCIANVTCPIDHIVTNDVTAGIIAEVIPEAMLMATYEQPHYKTKEDSIKDTNLQLAIVSNEDENLLNSALENGYAFGTGVNKARQLVTIPGNQLTATKLAEKAKEIAEEFALEYEILHKEDMERLGMGALLAVNQGSTEPPVLIVLKYQGLDEWKDAIALVGKGITFDTGGYSLKTKNGLMGMKTDMGGAAAVLGAMEIIGHMKPKKNVLAVIPSTDNMISGNAFKPDDVITSLSGKTIEVRNTDAEGKLALADGITYAKRHNVGKIVDIATLTGGVITALGDKLTGAMTNDMDFYKEVEAAAEYTNEPVWLLPYNDHFKQQVRNSDVADLNNSPGRKGHAVLAGAFLAEFVEDTPWVHLDIAGTATTDAPYDLGPKGATGIMARTLAKLIIG